MSSGKTSVTVAHFGTVSSTTNKIDTKEKVAELTFEADVASGVNPMYMAHAAQTVDIVRSNSVRIAQVGRTQRYRMTLTVALRPVGNMSNSRIVQMTVGDVLRAIENMQVPSTEQPTPNLSLVSGKTRRTRGSTRVGFRQPKG